jgi:hypothetical protein
MPSICLINLNPQTNVKKYINAIPVLALCAAAVVAMPASSRAQDATTNAPAVEQTAPAKPSKPRTLPFHGELASVDTNAMTLAVGKRTFQITSQTRIFKGEKPATLSDGVAGQPVRGSYRKNDNGGLDAVTVRFGSKTTDSTKPATDSTKPATGN